MSMSYSVETKAPCVWITSFVREEEFQGVVEGILSHVKNRISFGLAWFGF